MSSRRRLILSGQRPTLITGKRDDSRRAVRLAWARFMTTAFKDQAHKLIDRLPETAGWEELVETVETILDIEAGLADSAAGRVTDTDEVRREFGLK